eukprot:5907962-Amphidinium_carterae.1
MGSAGLQMRYLWSSDRLCPAKFRLQLTLTHPKRTPLPQISSPERTRPEPLGGNSTPTSRSRSIRLVPLSSRRTLYSQRCSAAASTQRAWIARWMRRLRSCMRSIAEG